LFARTSTTWSRIVCISIRLHSASLSASASESVAVSMLLTPGTATVNSVRVKPGLPSLPSKRLQLPLPSLAAFLFPTWEPFLLTPGRDGLHWNQKRPGTNSHTRYESFMAGAER
jgi:hypothetical protein